MCCMYGWYWSVFLEIIQNYESQQSWDVPAGNQHIQLKYDATDGLTR